MKDLIVPIKVETKELFTTVGVDTVLKAIDVKIAEFSITSTDTQKDRDAIRSFCAKVVRTKTFLEKTGKDFVAEKKALIKIFDSSRKRLRDSLTEKAAQVRKPLTDWEDDEKIRVEAERQFEIYLLEWDEAIAEDDLFNRERAIAAKEAEIAKQEDERLAKEKAERDEKDRIEREERLKKEAAEKAEKEAAEEILAEREERERIKLEAQEAKEQAELDRIAAEEKAKADQDAAVKKAKDDAEARIKADKKAEDERIAEENRIKDQKAANKRHQASVNNKIKDALMACVGLDEKTAKKVIIEAVNGNIPFMSINY